MAKKAAAKEKSKKPAKKAKTSKAPSKLSTPAAAGAPITSFFKSPRPKLAEETEVSTPASPTATAATDVRLAATATPRADKEVVVLDEDSDGGDDEGPPSAGDKLAPSPTESVAASTRKAVKAVRFDLGDSTPSAKSFKDEDAADYARSAQEDEVTAGLRAVAGKMAEADLTECDDAREVTAAASLPAGNKILSSAAKCSEAMEVEDDGAAAAGAEESSTPGSTSAEPSKAEASKKGNNTDSMSGKLGSGATDTKQGNDGAAFVTPAKTASSGLTDRACQYKEEIAARLAAADISPESEPDYRLELDDAVPKEDTIAALDYSSGFPEELTPLLARVVQGSRLPLSELSAVARTVIVERISAAAGDEAGAKALEFLSGGTVLKDKLLLVAKRTVYGTQPKKAVINEDTSPEALWHWEVVSVELLPASAASTVKAVRKTRTNAGKRLRAFRKAVDVIEKHPNNAAKISKEEESIAKFRREDEAERQRQLRKQQEQAGKAAVLAKKAEEKQQKVAAKEAEKRRKEEEKAREEEDKRRANESMAKRMFGYFKKADSASVTAPGSAAKSGSGTSLVSSQPGTSAKDAISPADGSTGLEVLEEKPLAVVQSGRHAWDEDKCNVFEAELQQGLATEALLAKAAENARNKRRFPKAASRHQRPKRLKLEMPVQGGGNGFGEPAYCEIKEIVVSNRMKLLRFQEDTRPAYWGTFSRRSAYVRPRAPLKRDERLIDYENDSEAEWEEEMPGEDLASDDDADEEPEEDLDYQDGWLRRDGDVDDSEINLVSPNAPNGGKQQQQMQRAVVLGVLFIGGSSTSNSSGDSEAAKVLQQFAVTTPGGKVVAAAACAALAGAAAFGPPAGVQAAANSTPNKEIVKVNGSPAADGAAAAANGGAAHVQAATVKPRVKKPAKELPAELVPSLEQLLQLSGELKKGSVADVFVKANPALKKNSVEAKIGELAVRKKVTKGGPFVWLFRRDLPPETAAAAAEKKASRPRKKTVKPTAVVAAAATAGAASVQKNSLPADNVEEIADSGEEDALNGDAAPSSQAPLAPPPPQQQQSQQEEPAQPPLQTQEQPQLAVANPFSGFGAVALASTGKQHPGPAADGGWEEFKTSEP